MDQYERPDTGPLPGESRARTFWSSLTSEEQRAFASSAHRRRFKPGELLCREGEFANTVMVIQHGWTKVSVDYPRHERILALRGPGDLVGERAALPARARSATVVALDAVQVLLLPADEFAALVQHHPRFLRVLDHLLYDRLTEDRPPLFTEEPSDIAHRLASLILDLVRHTESGGAAPLSIPVSHRELASWADAPLKAVTKVLTSWHHAGLVQNSRGQLTLIDLAGLQQLCRQPEWRGSSPAFAPGLLGQNCSILLADITGFGGRDRDDQDRLVVRDRMYEMLCGGFAASGIQWATLYREDRGDGVLIVVPPAISTVAVADPMLTWLAAALRRHNHQASDAVRIQLRVALSVGAVIRDAKGVSGESIIQTARLVEAPVLKEQLEATSADLGFIASGFVYDSVIKHGPGYLDPAEFHEVSVRVKESVCTAWMRLFGASSTPIPAPAATSQNSGPAVIREIHVEGDLVLGNKNVFQR